MAEKTFFIISNGSNNIYADNTLTHFKNRLPEVLELPENENWVATVESIGFSCNFRSVYLPDDDTLPSFFISECYKNIPEKGNFCEDADSCNNVIYFDFQDNEDGKNCVWKSFRFEEKNYTPKEMRDFFFDNIIDTESIICRMDYTEDTGIFGATSMHEHSWLVIHPSMIKTFNIPTKPIIIDGKYYIKDNYRRLVEIDKDGPNTLSLNVYVPYITYYKNEKYYAYYLNEKKQIGVLRSSSKSVFTLPEKRFPKLVRIVCDNIKPQIFNSTYSQDLMVFCPDFDKVDRYYFHEFENKQYVRIANSILSDFEISLLDEENIPLQLKSGVPSIIKLSIKRMWEESFNVRLTSTVSKTNRSNKNSYFKVKLPNTLQLDRSWRVCLTYINHPNTFTTFHENENTRKLLFIKEGNNNQHYKFSFSDKIIYTKEDIVNELNKFFTKVNAGSASLINNQRLKITFNSRAIMVVSNYVLKVIGYTGPINNLSAGSRIVIDDANVYVKKINNNYELEFKSDINTDMLKPDYMIAYSNIVSSTIIGGSYNKILRIIPIYKSEEDYVIKEFIHKEYIEIENTEISEIEIALRAHDGTYVNFATNKEIILNLEFTKYK